MKDEFLDKWKSQVKKGTLSFLVLNAINKKELYGYELLEIIKKSTAIEIAEGTLYPLMNRLKKEGLTKLYYKGSIKIGNTKYEDTVFVGF